MSQSLVGKQILLVHPGIYDDYIARSYPPWGIICIAEALRRRGAEAIVLDLNGLNVDEALEKVFSWFRADVVGITGKMGLAAHRMRRMISWINAHFPNVPIGVGGPLVSSYPNLQDPIWNGVSSLFWGDGETSFVTWVENSCKKGQIFGPDEVADLDEIGMPSSWDGLREYVAGPEYWPNMDVSGIHASAARGCTRRCTFCYLNSQYPGSMFRFVSAPRLLQDLDSFFNRFGVRGFYFVDDCFIDCPPQRITDLCSALISRGSPYKFGCDVQLFELEQIDLLELMYEAGFRSLYLGLEAASTSVRKRLGKSRLSDDVGRVVQRVIEMGYYIRASIGIGWPGETEPEVIQTLELIDRVPGLIFDAYRYHPLPGVPLTQYWQRNSQEPKVLSSDHEAFEDFSVFNRNYSEIPDSRFDVYWTQILLRQNQRLALLHPQQRFAGVT